MKRLLIIKLRYIGDVILSTPLLPLLQKEYPGVEITFLVNKGTETVLRHNPFLRQIMVMPRKGWANQLKFLLAIRRAGFDAVIDLTDGDRSAFLSYWSGAGMRLGFNREHRWRGNFYSQVLPSNYGSMHMVDYHAQALKGMGIHDSVGDPEVFVGQKEEEEGRQYLRNLGVSGRSLVLLYPSARYVFKAWPLERFAALADRLGQLGMVTVLIGNQKEKILGQQIINLAKYKPVNLMGETRLLGLAGLMKHSVLFIGNDGGPMHLAAAVGCPVLGLFGPSNPSVWGPRGKKSAVIYKGLDCRSCFSSRCLHGENSCMGQITVEEVCQAARSLLAR